MLQLQHISKSFGGVPVLSDISLAFPASHIHSLLGENGAGKSTLMNILFGLLQPDAGTILLDGRQRKIASPRTAQSLAIGMVHQHFKLVPTLSPLQNLALATGAAPRVLRPRALAWLDKLAWRLPLDARTDALSVGQQQRTEILKALLTTDIPASQNLPRTLILDEPTAVLTPQETADLFAALLSLKNAGAAIIFITHKLAEVEKICDTIAILRRGQLVHSGPRTEITRTQIAEKMIGPQPPLSIPRPSGNAQGAPPPAPAPAFVSTNDQLPTTPPPVLSLQNASAGQLKNVSLHLRPGEILGIAGVDGNGQADLLAALVGDLPLSCGTLTLNGQNITRAPIRHRLESIALIPDDRHRLAAVLPLSLTDNLLLKDYRKPPFSTRGFLHPRRWRAHAQTLLQRFDIRANSPAATFSSLSGGNQQKVVLARELWKADKPLLLAANPTRGLDIAATAFVLHHLKAACARGAAVLLIHADLDELLQLADNISVLYNGTLTPAAALTKEAIAPLMLGIRPPIAND
jgi:simple sugar transport system ATP-binding protein